MRYYFVHILNELLFGLYFLRIGGFLVLSIFPGELKIGGSTMLQIYFAFLTVS